VGDGDDASYQGYMSETKRCGDFDSKAYLGVYICINCIDNEEKRYHFLKQYDKSTEARTDWRQPQLSLSL
jgi:hypothetical protein